MTAQHLQNGEPWPLGAHFDGKGVNFAIFSAHATAIDLCVFDASATHELARLPLPSCSNEVWHGYMPNAQPGLIYALRAHGPWRPDQGHRFDASKLLLDPYAREIVGNFVWRHEHFTTETPTNDRQTMTPGNVEVALKSRVVDDHFDWGEDAPPCVAMENTVIYECHVKGFSKLQPQIPVELRGSYAGLAHPVAIKHLLDLGVTTLSLLPVHYSLTEERLFKMGLQNYWGYNSIGFFCLNPDLASQSSTTRTPRDEFRQMVKDLHAAHLEVVLDVVFNHSAESDETGPTLCFRGLDNASYYRLKPGAPRLYENYSGCGNSLNVQHPRVLQLVMDSLRYWVQEMHVDGFRFDLAPSLGRTDSGFSPYSAFFAAIAQDPVLSRVKMIAEPWDIGSYGYQVGNFPRGWSEWNDKFRDCMRRFWVQGGASRGEFAMRLCASSDLFQASRLPASSINYVVSHDGFTLRDLVSYQHRHNLANGEYNRDGHGDNLSSNCGAEGPSEDASVQRMRGRLQRALLATTILAQGTPMLSAGDEFGHSQAGNNNPYCQDNTITWINWQAQDTQLLAFTQHLLRLKKQQCIFSKNWHRGTTDTQGNIDLTWRLANGHALQASDWQQSAALTLACLIAPTENRPASLLLLINASPAEKMFSLPQGTWCTLLDTSLPTGMPAEQHDQHANLATPAHSLLLLLQLKT